MSFESDAALDRLNYYNDSRVRAAMHQSPFLRIDESRMRGIIVLHSVFNEEEYLAECEANPDDLPDEEEFMVEEEAEVVIKYVVCSECYGSGKMVDPMVDAGGLTQDDFDRDPYLKDAYLDGEFDVTCSVCGGKRVEVQLDRALTDKDVLREYDKQERENREYEEMVLSELKYGC